MTLNDKRYILCSVARRYACYKRYEIDELINAAWLVKNVREQEETGMFWMAARWAMINYMKQQEKTNCKKYHIHTSPLIVGDSLTVEPETIPFNNVDYDCDFQWLTRPLTDRQRLVVKMKLEGFNWREIGRKIGYCGEYAKQIWKRASEVIRRRYEKSNRVA